MRSLPPNWQVHPRIPDIIKTGTVSVTKYGAKLRVTCEINSAVAGKYRGEKTYVTRHTLGHQAIRSRGENEVASFLAFLGQKREYRLAIGKPCRVYNDMRCELAFEVSFAPYQPKRCAQQERRPPLK